VDTGPALICIIDVREVLQVPCQIEKLLYFNGMRLLIVEMSCPDAARFAGLAAHLAGQGALD